MKATVCYAAGKTHCNPAAEAPRTTEKKRCTGKRGGQASDSEETDRGLGERRMREKKLLVGQNLHPAMKKRCNVWRMVPFEPFSAPREMTDDRTLRTSRLSCQLGGKNGDNTQSAVG